ncbi:hypothetical protein [Spirosoma fluminis]
MQLNAGPIQVSYDNGTVRTFIANGEEVLRMVYFALRDQDWNTIPVVISNESITDDGDTFQIRYDWWTGNSGPDMKGHVQVDGHLNGSITFHFYGIAHNTFWRNRIGFCVLHPIEGVAGQPCLLESQDGQKTESTFPDLISPHQPFFNISAMNWIMASGQEFRVAFKGDVFETEDQRNWTDASYKTYSTPLERPIPVEIQPGTEIRQQIIFQPIQLSLNALALVAAQINQHSSVASTKPSIMPRVGVGQRADGPPLTPAEAEILRKANFSHLRADVFFPDANWKTTLLSAQHDSALLNVPLELALFFGQDARNEAQQLIDIVQERNLSLYSISLFDATTWTTDDALLSQLIPPFREQLPDVKLGGGTDANFVDVNRRRFDFSRIDFVTYSINPQVHAFDDQTLLENVAAQADTVRSARELSGGKPVHISPITLRPRFNPDAKMQTLPRKPPADPRQTTDFGATWTRQSLETLTRAGAASVTYFETHGPRGLMGQDPYPVLSVFAERVIES